MPHHLLLHDALDVCLPQVLLQHLLKFLVMLEHQAEAAECGRRASAASTAVAGVKDGSEGNGAAHLQQQAAESSTCASP